jgi:dTDP-4-amino-4,6-dideoxygalactose transaminase
MKVPLIDLKAQYSLIQHEIRDALEEVLSRQKFILDREVVSLENEICALTGSRFAVACASGTDALLLSLLAVGIQPGDEIITTSYSFFATAGMISWIKAKPVFVDIDPQTYEMDTSQVKGKITKKTKGIVAVHLFGQCCRIEDLLDFGIPVIEDAAQAIASSRNGQQAGSMGITGCFSFFPTKNLGAYGDGGMITVQNEEFANKIRSLRSHGQSDVYIHSMVGTNSRLDELQAAVLLVKLRHLSKWNEKRRQNAAFYQTHLRDLPLQLPAIATNNISNYHQFVIRCEKRDQLKTFLANQGIGSAIYYPVPLPLQPCFSELGYKAGDFPNAESCAKTSLALPIFPELTEEQLEFTVDRISAFFRQ